MSRFRSIRYTSAGPVLDTFLVFSIGSVLVTRAYLAATGYPQVGGKHLHIAHVVWGGLLMLIAIALALTTIDLVSKRVIAVVGGIGFGLFLDEIGKFLTKNTDYFYKPAISIIYLSFVALFYVFRYVEREGNTSPETALANVFAIISESTTRTLSRTEINHAQYLLSLAPDEPGTAAARTLLAQAEVREPKPSRVLAFLDRWFRRPFHRFAQSRLFIWLIGIYAAVIAFAGLIVLFDVILLLVPATRAEAECVFRIVNGVTTTGLIILAMTSVFIVMMTLGLLRLRRHRLRALMWFDRAYLYSILVIQVFVFAHEQLAAIGGFIIDLLVWGAIRIALQQERARLHAEEVGTNAGPTPGPTPDTTD